MCHVGEHVPGINIAGIQRERKSLSLYCWLNKPLYRLIHVTHLFFLLLFKKTKRACVFCVRIGVIKCFQKKLHLKRLFNTIYFYMSCDGKEKQQLNRE